MAQRTVLWLEAFVITFCGVLLIATINAKDDHETQFRLAQWFKTFKAAEASELSEDVDIRYSSVEETTIPNRHYHHHQHEHYHNHQHQHNHQYDKKNDQQHNQQQQDHQYDYQNGHQRDYEHQNQRHDQHLHNHNHQHEHRVNAQNHQHHRLRSQCPSNFTGQLPYADDCKLFINCWYGNGYLQSCAPGTLFNAQELKCDFTMKVNCETARNYANADERNAYQNRGGITNNRTTQNANKHNNSNNQNNTHIDDVSLMICQRNVSGYKPHPTNCTLFINCTMGYARVLRCGHGMAYSKPLQRCDYVQNVDCNDRERLAIATVDVEYYQPGYNRQSKEWKNVKTAENINDNGNGTMLNQIFNTTGSNRNLSHPTLPEQHQRNVTRFINGWRPTIRSRINSAGQTTTTTTRSAIERPQHQTRTTTLYSAPLAPFESNGKGPVMRSYDRVFESSYKNNNNNMNIFIDSNKTTRKSETTSAESLAKNDHRIMVDGTDLRFNDFNIGKSSFRGEKQVFATPITPLAPLIPIATIHNDFVINDTSNTRMTLFNNTQIHPYKVRIDSATNIAIKGHNNRPEQTTITNTDNYTFIQQPLKLIKSPSYLTNDSAKSVNDNTFSSINMDNPVTTTSELPLNEALRMLLRPYAPKESIAIVQQPREDSYLSQMVEGIKNHSIVETPVNGYSTNNTFITSMQKNEDKKHATHEGSSNTPRILLNQNEKDVIDSLFPASYTPVNSNSTMNSTPEKLNRKQLREVPEAKYVSSSTIPPNIQDNLYTHSQFWDTFFNSNTIQQSNAIPNENSDTASKEKTTDSVTYCNLPKTLNNSNHKKAVDIDFEIRLTDGMRPKEGRIKLKVEENWGYLCSGAGTFDKHAADVTCHELGYPMAREWHEISISNEIQSPRTFTLNDLHCFGNETKLRDCNATDLIEQRTTTATTMCPNNKIIELLCDEQLKCPNNFWLCEKSSQCIPMAFVCDKIFDCGDQSDESAQVCNISKIYRLSSGANAAEGRLEVFHHGEWGTICDDDFGVREARVACRSLGFNINEPIIGNSYGIKNYGPIWLNQVSCRGDETSIDQCEHKKWGQHNCNHSEDVGIKCVENIKTNTAFVYGTRFNEFTPDYKHVNKN